MRIGLALSGGGTRAAVFHIGVIRRLARAALLENVTKLSTVSGGSLAAALVFSHSGLKWPTSTDFESSVYPKLEHLLTTVDLFTLNSIATSPREWHRVPLDRARVVANFLARRWAVRGKVRELYATPEWFINTTCIESGKNWRFSQGFMGDWVTGRHYDSAVTIAEAAAASAAVPYVIGALKLALPEDGWYEIDPATDKPQARKERRFDLVNLWDGGAYENLGLEPLYKMDRGMIDCDLLIVSDASGALTIGKRASFLNLFKGNLAGPRLFDIASDQIRSLRSRIFMDALLSGKAAGALIRMGNSVRDVDIKARRERPAEAYGRFLADREVSQAFKYPTNLAALSVMNFERIARHGFEVTDATLTAHCPVLAPVGFDWGSTQ